MYCHWYNIIGFHNVRMFSRYWNEIHRLLNQCVTTNIPENLPNVVDDNKWGTEFQSSIKTSYFKQRTIWFLNFNKDTSDCFFLFPKTITKIKTRYLCSLKALRKDETKNIRGLHNHTVAEAPVTTEITQGKLTCDLYGNFCWVFVTLLRRYWIWWA